MNLSIDKVRLSLKHASIVRDLESLENSKREQSHSMQDLEVNKAWVFEELGIDLENVNCYVYFESYRGGD